MDSEELALSTEAKQVLDSFKALSQDDKEELMQCHFMDEVGWYTLDNRPNTDEPQGPIKYEIQRGIYHMDGQTIIDKGTVDVMTEIHHMFATQTKAMSVDLGCQRTKLILWAQDAKDWPEGMDTPGSYHPVKESEVGQPGDRGKVGKELLACYKGPRQFGHVVIFYYEKDPAEGMEGWRLERITMSILVHHYADNRQKLIDAGYDVTEVDKAYNYYSH